MWTEPGVQCNPIAAVLPFACHFDGRNVSESQSHCLINAVSLTTPAVSRVFSLRYCQTRAHFSVGARTASFSVAPVHRCHPNLLGPFTIINSVLPTKHLFDHHRP